VKENYVTASADTEEVTNPTAPFARTLTTVHRAYAFALNPTPEQIGVLHSHVGGTRFVYNAPLGLVKANWDENHAKKRRGHHCHQGGLPQHVTPGPAESLVRQA